MNNPRIKLAGKEYEIPEMAIRQNRRIEVLALKNRDYFIRGRGLAGLAEITEDQAEDFTRIVYHALTRTLPALTYEEFETWPLSLMDIVIVLPTCLAQTGLFKPAAETAPATGEAIPPSIGTES